MSRILTGIQSSGRPHLGNILGAIMPSIELSKDLKNECFFFIADLHSLTSIKDGKMRKENIIATAAAWLAFGFDTEKNTFYRQSKIPEVCELAWYLNCYTPYPMLANAHSFKDKSNKLSNVNAGLFTYPILMTADIILYDAEFVPVGKDQKQHLEITKDIAQTFNRMHQNTFVIPEAIINNEVKTVPGIDGQKMSKSYGNTIDIFLSKKQLRKKIMSIVTDSKELHEPKNPNTCNVFNIYKLLAKKVDVLKMKENYENGNYGYGSAKNELFELIIKTFSEERKKFDYYLNNPKEVERKLEEGEIKARKLAIKTISKVRKVLGYQ